MFITSERIYFERFVVMTAQACGRAGGENIHYSGSARSTFRGISKERTRHGKATRRVTKAGKVFNIYDDMFIRRYVLLIDAPKIGLR
jgi:hypothetical protein